jgi:drug/metabolite transporter (DMT)-like permease
LAATLFYGAALVMMQFAFRFAPPWRGAAISVPTAAVLFVALAPFNIDFSQADWRGAILFMLVGALFPASVTLLSMESNRRMGPNVAGAIGNTAPLFAVLAAVLALGETLGAIQAAGIAAIVGGITLLSRNRMRESGAWPLWLIVLPFAAAAIRGLAPPAIKVGLAWWPSPLAATTIGYVMSAMILIAAAHVRAHGPLPPVALRGKLWFAVLGICNGLTVLLLYAALLRAPVTLVAPLFAAYPLVTLALARIALRDEPFATSIAGGVAATVAGVVLLVVGHG